MATKTFLTNDDKVELLERIDEAVAGDIELSQYARVEDIPTSTSELTNDSGFITANDMPESANIKKNPNATDGDIIDTHLTVGNRTGAVGKNTVCMVGLMNDSNVETYVLANTAEADGSVIMGGGGNKTTGRSYCSGIFGGVSNEIKEGAGIILGGYRNTINSGLMDGSYAILGGSSNVIDYASGGIVIGGRRNILEDSDYDGGGGAYNAISLGGVENTVRAHQIKTGHYATDGRSGYETGTSGDALIIGNGSSKTSRANAFRVAYDGNVYGTNAYNSTGADYAELFEWIDGNLNNEDRRGRFVTLEGEKIRFATTDDDYILGVISAAPCLVGDSFSDDWQGKYLTDVFGKKLTQTVHYEAEYSEIESIDPETGEKTIEKVLIRDAYDAEEWVLNPDYDPEKEYVPREERPEWAYVGSMGKLVVVDDGTCITNGYCKVGENGVATYSAEKSNYRVMARLDDTHIKIILK